MQRKGLFSLITLILVAPSLSLACNWIRVGEFGESLECRSNYKEFFGTNSKALNKLLMEAAYYAVGEAEKITSENWMIRNTVPVKDGAQLLENRFQAEELLHAMNGQLRQLETLNGKRTLGDYTIPSAMMVGLTVQANGAITNLPLGGVFSKLAPNPGGSFFIGWVIVPQKVQFVMNDDGQLVGPVQYAVPNKEVKPESYQGKLTSLLTPAPEGASLNFSTRNIRLESRFVVIPSLDIKTGKAGAYKQNAAQPTLGFVFSRDLIRPHQIINNGPSASVPGSFVRTLKNATGHLGNFVLPNWLITPVERYVDTIKVGTSLSAQDPLKEANTNSTMQFSENMFVWMRFADAKKAKTKVAAAADGLVTGKFRPSWFWVVAPKNDGESENFSNGFNMNGTSTLGVNLVSSIQSLLANLETNDAENSNQQNITILEQSLTDSELSAEDRVVIEQAIDGLRQNQEENVE